MARAVRVVAFVLLCAAGALAGALVATGSMALVVRTNWNPNALSEERAVADRFAPEVARRVQGAGQADVVLVHDPRVAADLGGLTPLVPAGHTHRASSRQLSDDTLMLIEGSTGGAGLPTLETGEATALTKRHIVPLLPDDDERGP